MKRKAVYFFTAYDKSLTDQLIGSVGHRMGLGDLLQREGAKACVSIQSDVVDMDAVAVDNAGSEIPSSVDMVFGCERNRVQLAECKYRVGGSGKQRKKLTPPSQSEFKSKVADTRALLQSAEYTSLAPTLAILFADNHIEQARAWVNDYNAGKKQPLYKEMTTAEFLSTFFTEDINSRG